MSIARPPNTHEIIAAGPASADAYSAPKSHPEPMIDPSEKKSSPSVLTSLCSLRPACVSPRSSVCVVITNPPLLAHQIRQHTSMIHVPQLPSGAGMQPCRGLRHGRVAQFLSAMIVSPFCCKAVGIVGHRLVWSKYPPRVPGVRCRIAHRHASILE